MQNLREIIPLPKANWHHSGVWLGIPPPIELQHKFIFIDRLSGLVEIDLTDAFFVVACDAHEQDEILTALRKNQNTALSLILVIAPSPLSPYLANGTFDMDTITKVEEYFHKKSLVNLYYENNREFTLLTYLWLHSGNDLSPIKDPKNASVYYYPLFDAWGINIIDSFALLAQLQSKGWLESTRLESRIRCCPSCQSARLNYIDVCPRCFGIEINLRASLHCFNCGHIGEQSSFRESGMLACPNCLTQLRHIGVDYDRPIETHSCHHCQHLFVDAKVQAQCLECGTTCELSDLIVRNVRHYHLTQTGRLLVIQGALDQLFADNSSNIMDTNQFYWLVKWQNDLAKRHNLEHAIISMKLLNLQEIVSSKVSFDQLQEFQQRLSSVVRGTDACSQFTEEGLLLFLPFISPDEIQHVFQKLTDLIAIFPEEFKFSFCEIHLPAEIGSDVKSWLVDNLASLER